MRILIVEDEDLEHEGLSDLISNLPLDMSVCGHAWNGQEALGMAESLRPDIVITDVRMPVMDGIEFCERLRALLPGCFVIIISGFEDFQAACDAVRLQVCAWLVKPVNREELLCVLRDIHASAGYTLQKQQEEIRRERWIETLLPLASRDLYQSLLLGSKDLNDPQTLQQMRESGMELLPGKYAAMVAEIQDATKKDSAVLSTLVERISADVDIPDVVAAIPMPGGRMALVLTHLPIADNDVIQSRLEAGAERLLTQAAAGSGSCVGVGVSLISSEASSLSTLYYQACDALQQKVCFGRGRVIFYAENQADPADWMRLPEGDGLSKALESGNARQAARLSSEFVASLAVYTDMHKAVATCLDLLSRLSFQEDEADPSEGLPAAKRLLFERLISFQTIPDLAAHMDALLGELISAMETQNARRDEQIVRRAKRIVEENLGGNLSTEAIAARVYLAASHLRRVFKNRMGITLQDYVLRERMTRAKKLLANPEHRVTDVALSVGYENTSYFCVVFKQFTGLTPTEYRIRQH